MTIHSTSKVCFARACFAVLVLVAAHVDGAQRTWDGGGSDWDWHTLANWDGTIRLDPIEQGDTLVFPEGPAKLINTNDFGANTNFNSLIYSGDDYRTYGNRIGLSNGVSVTHASGATALHLPILLRRDQTFSVSSANAFLHLFGEINIGIYDLTFDGAGGIVLISEVSNSRFGTRGRVLKTGSGRLTIFQQTDHDAPTIVSGGTLAVEHRMTNSIVTVQSGGTLRGSGRIGGLNAVGGLVHPGGTTPDALECRGDATLAAGSILRIRLNGTSPGVTYDQLDVVGTVTLGGTLDLVFGYSPAVGDKYTIIENDGSDDVAGTFAGMPEGHVFTANGRPFKISYGGRVGPFGRENDVTIEAIPAVVVWDGGGPQNNWSDPQNWSGDVLPGPGDDVHFSSTNGTLATVNDFPVGRRFGSLTFLGPSHLVNGANMAMVDRGIRLPESNSVRILMPITLEGGVQVTEGSFLRLSDITAAANQAFHAVPSNAVISLGRLAGSATLTKEGLGILRLGTNDASVTVVVNDGEVTGQRVEGPLIVNQGAALSGPGYFAEVEVRGGTLRPDMEGTTVDYLRMLDGAVFAVAVLRRQTTNDWFNSFVRGTTVELLDCTLDVTVDSRLEGDVFSIIITDVLTGTFNGLPEGAWLGQDGRSFQVTYINDSQTPDNIMSSFVKIIGGRPTWTWDGGGPDNFWTTPGNWVGNAPPTPGCHLNFPANVDKLAAINDFPDGTTFGSMTFLGPDYVIAGNSMVVHLGVINALASGETTIYANLSVGMRGPGLPFLPYGTLFAFNVQGSSRVNVEAAITSAPNSGECLKTGSGTLRLSGSADNNIGRMEVHTGALELAKSDANALSGSIAIGDNGFAVVRLMDSDQIADNAVVYLASTAGRLDLNGHTEAFDYLGGFGTVVLDTRIGRGGRLILDGGSFSGDITGAGGITKVGNSTLLLNGTSDFSGTTVVTDGSLSVVGSISASTVQLDGGMLEGDGPVGEIVGGTGGVLFPGAVGDRTLQSSMVQLNAATTFRTLLTQASPPSDCHRLQVTGTVTLGGCRLDADNSSVHIPLATEFVIIENDGADPVVGTFSGLPEGAILSAGGLPVRVSYVGGTGNDVVLKRVSLPPATMISIQRVGNLTTGRGLGLSQAQYRIQWTTILNPLPEWSQIAFATANSDGVFQFSHTAAATQGFYRALSP